MPMTATAELEMHLSFSIVNGGAAVQLHCDVEGLDALIAKLQEARSTGHLHLRSFANGGTLLNDHDPWGDAAIGEVIVSTGGD